MVSIMGQCLVFNKKHYRYIILILMLTAAAFQQSLEKKKAAVTIIITVQDSCRMLFNVRGAPRLHNL